MNRLYMTQRWLTTSSLTGPASSTIDASAAATTTPSTTSDGLRSFSRLTSPMAAMKRG